MTHTFKLARRMSRFRASSLVVALLLAGACDSAKLLDSDTDTAANPSFSLTSTPVSVSNLSVRSGKTYRVVSGLAAGAQLYVDRTYTAGSPIPSEVSGVTYIRTANDDKDAYPGNTSFLSFDVSVNALVYVAHDDRLARPSWLTSGFQNTGLDLLNVDGTKLSLFKRSVPAGRVTLGSNVTVASGRSMYVVLVQAAPTTSTVSPDVVSSSSTYTASTAPGIPVGTFGLPMGEYSNTSLWTGSLKHLTPGSSAITELNAAKTRGARVVISMAGGPSSYKNADGTFSLSKWKYNVSKWKSIAIGSFITDGTLIGHYMVDEPQVTSHWGGQRISNADLDAMAQYSKSIWPGLATTVRMAPGNLKGYTWRYLDFAWAQWEGSLHVPSFQMTPEQFRDKNVADAQAAGLKLMFGINYLDGGDGSSKIAGTYDLRTVSTRWQMSAAEVERVGKVLAGATFACGLISWRWSPDYPSSSYLTSTQLAGIRAFNTRSDVRTALGKVAYVGKNRTRTSCRRT